MSPRSITSRALRSTATTGRRRVATGAAFGAASLIALSACVTEQPAPGEPSIPGPDGVEVVGRPCAPNTGVTVVVDFGELDDLIRIGCAPGAQPDGFAALAAAGFTVGSEAGPGSVCTIEGLPTTAFPDCWYAGYWGYFKSPNSETPWGYSMVGAGDGPLPVGSYEGYSWTVGWDGVAPRVSIATLAEAAN